MKDLTDFAVLCKGVTIPSKKDDTLRVIPLSTAPSISDAIKGLSQGSEGSLVPGDLDKNMPKNEAGVFIDNVVKVQHKSDGYCRIVAKLTNNPSNEEAVASAKGFVLIQKVEKEKTWKPIAVASLNAGIDLTQLEIYVAFTFSKTNNYQSVSFNPNAFATIEDINEINGLDGLHIAFDHTSGDIKLLDGEGNVLDQANLHMDADTIITDGEEGYKYVKTDVQQDIHAAKAWMPAGKTAGVDVDALGYSVQKACFLVDVTNEQDAVDDAQAAVKTAQEDVATAQAAVYTAKAGADEHPDDQTYQSSLEEAQSALSAKQKDLETAQSALSKAQADLAGLISSKAVREGTSPAICGIRVNTGNGSTDYALCSLWTNADTKKSAEFFGVRTPSDNDNMALAYSPEAFVWTVGEVPKETPKNPTFSEKLNASAKVLGFHVGDDIPLGTYLPSLCALNVQDTGFDPSFVHEGTVDNDIDELVDAQRNLAKEELTEWNKQHPALVHDGFSGTRISSDGVDIRNGKIEIGNGAANATGEQHKEDNVKRYVIETDIDVVGDVARADTGLQIGVIDSLSETGNKPIQKDILTINAEDYISGAPTCLALLKCSKSGDPATVFAGLDGGRITANFTASGAETDGGFTLTITDNRANNGFGTDPRIVEIIPVYKSGADATEAVPAQRSISAIEKADTNTKKTLSIQCSQVIDWAQSIDLDPVNSDGKPVPNGMELYLIVKVY